MHLSAATGTKTALGMRFNKCLKMHAQSLSLNVRRKTLLAEPEFKPRYKTYLESALAKLEPDHWR